MSNKLKRLTCLALSVIMLLSLAACGTNSNNNQNDEFSGYQGKVNQTIESDSKWICSMIEGAIDDTLVISEKDDFYTAVNKEWILDQTLDDETDEIDVFTLCADTVKERKLDIICGNFELNTDFEDVSSDELTHDSELVSLFASTASDWESRNLAGAEPLRKYIDSIESISSIEEMTEYLCSTDASNFTGENFLGIDVMSSVVDQFNYRVTILPASEDTYLLQSPSRYKNFDLYFPILRDQSSKCVCSILESLGYTEKKAEQIVRLCYRLEGKLADHDDTLNADAVALEKIGKIRTMDDLIKLCGNFPIDEILSSYGFENAEQYRACGDGYLSYLGRMYNDSNLEMMKAYLIAHTVIKASSLLTRENYESTKLNKSEDEDETVKTGEDAEYNDEWDIILNDFITPYLSGPMDIVYIAQYCSKEMKSKVSSLIYDILDKYHELINSEDWLSETAKIDTIEKLDSITVRALYPDKFDSYESLVFTDSDTLVDMVAKINAYRKTAKAQLADQPVDKNRWNLDDVSTTITNAYYMPTDNSINILAGILSDDSVFSDDISKEKLLATIGVVIGHEITHGFDDTGSQYDKDGVQRSWWDLNDKTTFMLRAQNLKLYYSSIIPYAYGYNLNGTKLSGEAIADMGGMKVTLMIADDINNFDYDLYFKSFAKFWATLSTFSNVSSRATGDPHPLANLRVNVTVMQFDEFIDTYDIHEGDGMYLSPEKRIAVW